MTTAYEDGSPTARICLIGEAPGRVEQVLQRPFVGPSGKLLESCLHASDIARSECRILNVFETPVHKPADSGKLFDRSGGTLLWTPTKGLTDAGIVASQPFRERLAASTANVLVPLGGTALSAVLGAPRPISKWRGSILVNEIGRKLVPSLHPAAILRGEFHNRFLLISDLQKARAESLTPTYTPTQRRMIIDPSHADCIAFLDRCLTAPAVNTDIELLNGQVDCFSLAISPTEAISIPIVETGFEHRWSAREELEIWRRYAAILASPHITKINTNITFDVATLLQLNGFTIRGRLEDPQVAHSVMYPALLKSLALMCSLYTDQPYYKDQGELHDSYTVDDFARRWNYSALDSAISLECWQKLEPMLDANDYRRTYEMTMRLIPSLVYMMVNGMRVDIDEMKATRTRVEADLAVKLTQLQTAFARPIITEAPKTAAAKRAAVGSLNINSSQQVMGYFYKEKGLKPYLGAGGKPTVDDRALARIVRRAGLPEAKLVQEYRGLAKVLSTFLDMGYGADSRMRCSYNARGTWTGRLSSSQTVFGEGGNQQNLPDEARNFLVSDAA